VSEIANRYISDPSEALKLGQKVKVKILEVDIPRKRIALSIKQTEEGMTAKPQRPANQPRNRQPRENDLSALSVSDALNALKKKFGK
jgi:uncharacterized protein